MISKIIGFDQGNVKVEQHSENEWTAISADNYNPNMPVGYGSTMIEAIIDLRDKMETVE